MFILKHKPSNKYVRHGNTQPYRVNSSYHTPRDLLEYLIIRDFTDNINEARIYRETGHIKNSIGEGRPSKINTDLWEVIEVTLSKE